MLIEFNVINKDTEAELHVEVDDLFDTEWILEEIGCIDEDGNEIGSGEYVIEDIEADFDFEKDYFKGWDLYDFYNFYEDHLSEWFGDRNLFCALTEVFEGDLDKILDYRDDYFLMEEYENWEQLGRSLFEEDVELYKVNVKFAEAVELALDFAEYAKNRYADYWVAEFTSYGFVYGY